MRNEYPSLKTLSLISISFVMFMLVVTASSIAEDNNMQQTSASLSEVEHQYVCMVNDQLFVKEQIPVELEGKTYYGCCEMCKEKIKTDAASRESVDPVSGKKIDKSDSVIGAAPDGSVYYFESEENLQKYNSTASN